MARRLVFALWWALSVSLLRCIGSDSCTEYETRLKEKENQPLSYQEWKKAFITASEILIDPSETEKLTRLKLLQLLATMVSINLERPDWRSDLSRVLYPYNFLRELLDELPVASLEEIATAWLERLKYELDFDVLIEEGHTPATPIQEEFAKAEVKRLSFERPIEVFTHPAIPGRSGPLGIKEFISFCRNPDLDTRLYILYHELGHIQHNDTANYKGVELGKKTLSAVRAEPDVIADVEDIKRYLQLGWSAIPSLQETILGKYLFEIVHYDNPTSSLYSQVSELVKKPHGLWIPPADVKEQEKAAYNLEKERRADLFALRHLYKQGRMSSILTFIRDFSMSDLSYRTTPWIIAVGATDHPSDVERALYAIGFLIAQGVDVPKVLREWEMEGTCTPAEES
jgi:hypothetical protein